MTKFSSGDTLPDTSVIELGIWRRVAAFRESGAVAIQGMAGTDADWLHELAKHQELLNYANRIWPESPESPGTMSQEELTVLAEMRLAHPSEEDSIWEAAA